MIDRKNQQATSCLLEFTGSTKDEITENSSFFIIIYRFPPLMHHEDWITVSLVSTKLVDQLYYCAGQSISPVLRLIAFLSSHVNRSDIIQQSQI